MKTIARRASLVVLFVVPFIACDDEDGVVGPAGPSVAGSYRGSVATLEFSCVDPGEIAQITAEVQQDGDRIVIQTSDGIMVEGRIFETGVFSASGVTVIAGFIPDAPVSMVGQFDGDELVATRLLDASVGDVICESRQNLQLFRES